MTHAVLRPDFLRRYIFGRSVSPAQTLQAAEAVPSRMLLLAACALAIGFAAWWGDPSGYLQTDPALARLLRAMAVIKGMIALAAVGAVFWRFGFPTSTKVALSYAVGSALLAGSTMLIWQLTLIPLAALLFHASMVGMLIVGWRER